MTANTNTATAPTTPTAPHVFFTQDPRVTRVVEYTDGFVPNSYKWPAPGTCTVHERLKDGTFRTSSGSYDRKRSHGRGPSAVGFSARNGRLLSYRY